MPFLTSVSCPLLQGALVFSGSLLDYILAMKYDAFFLVIFLLKYKGSWAVSPNSSDAAYSPFTWTTQKACLAFPLPHPWQEVWGFHSHAGENGLSSVYPSLDQAESLHKSRGALILHVLFASQSSVLGRCPCPKVGCASSTCNSSCLIQCCVCHGVQILVFIKVY